jgi:hypothetical protein
LVTELWLYIEGGGNKDSKARLRESFSRFLSEPRLAAYKRSIQLRIVMCGSREEAYRMFEDRLLRHPSALVFLVVDAERPVSSSSAREHLRTGEERWDLSIATDKQCHLMAQVMESWFLADPTALERFYGKGFAAGQLSKRKNVEEVPKDEVMTALDGSTRKTQKGRYHKIQHGPLILESLAPEKVRARAPHCDLLFEELLKAVA